MVGEPCLFAGAEILLRTAVAEILLMKLLVVMGILILYAVHGRVQVVQELRPVFVDGEVDVRGPDLADGRGGFRPAEDVHCDKGVQLSLPEHFQGIGLVDGQLHQIDVEVVRPRPILELRLLYAVPGDADPLAIEGRVVVGADFRVVRRDKEIISLGAHGERGEKHRIGAVLHIGDIAK